MKKTFKSINQLFAVTASKALCRCPFFSSSENLFFFSLTYESLSYPIQRPSRTSSISEQLRHLRRKFSDRTDAIKEIIHQPPDFERDAASSSICSFTIRFFLFSKVQVLPFVKNNNKNNFLVVQYFHWKAKVGRQQLVL